MRLHHRWIVGILGVGITLLIICNVDATLSKSDKKSKKAKKASAPKNEVVQNVMSRDLVQAEHTSSSVVNEHSRYSELEKEVRRFEGPVLGYVTPWNSKGYDIAKMFHKKFTLVSPVWLQVVPKQNKEYEMRGGHDIDSGWASEVVRGGDNLLVPRVLFDKWSMVHYEEMFSGEESMTKCAKTITSFIKKHGFGGVTVEIWNQVAPQLQYDMIHFLVDLADMLHKANKIIVLVVPPLTASPSNQNPKFTKANFEELKGSVDYFNVMTYDYHTQTGTAGPISPIGWVEKSIRSICPQNDAKDRSKLLLGINFYGVKFGEFSGVQPVIGHEFINILKVRSAQVSWQVKDAEHLYSYKDEQNGESLYMFYPSLLFLQERLTLASKLGTGVGIWEIGQGLDYFYDLL